MITLPRYLLRFFNYNITGSVALRSWHTDIPSEHATSIQRLLNVVQTSMTFGQRSVDVVTTSSVHWFFFII